jgi:predicted phosphodiesterase
MKLNVLSDLHLSCGALAVPENDADAIILAGHIARPRDALSWASGFAKAVLYVPGNNPRARQRRSHHRRRSERHEGVMQPAGYAQNGVNENPLFDPNLLVTID